MCRVEFKFKIRCAYIYIGYGTQIQHAIIQPKINTLGQYLVSAYPLVSYTGLLGQFFFLNFCRSHGSKLQKSQNFSDFCAFYGKFNTDWANEAKKMKIVKYH